VDVEQRRIVPLRVVALALLAGLLAATAAWGWAQHRSDEHLGTATIMLHPLEGNAYSPGGRGDDLVNLETEAQVLRSDTVARAVLDQLHEGGTPADLLAAVTVSVPPNTQLLQITARGPDDATAVARASAFGDVFLKFRRSRTESAVYEQTSRLEELVKNREDERDAAVTEWLDAHPSVVYVAFGSVTRMTADQVRSLVELARRLGDDHGLLWVLHRDQQRLLPAELPANLKVVPWVHSQLGVLEHPHVRAFFTHGGSNSIHESLYFGVPVLVRPTLVDQFDHAVRAVDTGIGLTVERPDRIDVDDTHGRLLRLLHEPGFADRAREIGQVQRSAGGLRVAGDAVLMELREASVPTPSA